MKERIDELLGALNEEILLQKELLALGTAKRDALVAIDMPKVDALSRKEQNVLLALGSTAGGRLRITDELSKGLGAGRSSVTEIAAHVGEPASGALRTAAAELREVMRGVARVTESNRMLTEESLAQVKQFFHVISGSAEAEATYTRQGTIPAAPPPRLMIDEVA